MKLLKFSSKLFIASFALLILTNVVVLLGVYLNRSSEPTSHATLTQRELRLPYSVNKENSNISLKLVYRIFNKQRYSRNADWLNLAKLKELGFNTDKYLYTQSRRQTPSKEVFVVLEYDGQAYKDSLKLAEERFTEKEALYKANNTNNNKRAFENAKRNLTREQTSASRLFAIDAGLDANALRQQYLSKDKYLVVKGLVKVIKGYKHQQAHGYIQQLNVQKIHLPYEFKHLIQGVKPKYSVELNYGSRYEPWISSFKRIY